MQRNNLLAVLEPLRHASGRGLEAKEAGGFFLFADAVASAPGGGKPEAEKNENHTHCAVEPPLKSRPSEDRTNTIHHQYEYGKPGKSEECPGDAHQRELGPRGERRVHKLRKEREHEKHHLRVQEVAKEPASKGGGRRFSLGVLKGGYRSFNRGAVFMRFMTAGRKERTKAEIEEVSGTRPFEDGKELCGPGNHRRNPKNGCDGMHRYAAVDAEGASEGLTAPGEESCFDNDGKVGAGQQRDDKNGRQKEQVVCEREHDEEPKNMLWRRLERAAQRRMRSLGVKENAIAKSERGDIRPLV